MATDDDERDETNGAVTATITSGETYRVGEAASATVQVIDNDVLRVSVAPTALMIREGNSDSYMVVLDAEPTADVTVAVQVPADAEVAVDKTELTFTDENWQQAQIVTVTAAQDADAVADDTVVLTHAVSGGNYDTVTAASVAVTILEDDTPALSVAHAVTSEGDGEMVFTVRLDLTSNQTVTVEYATATGTAAEGRDYETTTGTLTFSALETEQTIRVPIIDDDIDEVAETLRLVLINASNATITDGGTIGVITDNDERGAIVTPTALTVDEGGSTSYTVVLTSEPTTDVTVAVQVPADAELAVDETELTFTAEDWNQAQTVTVAAIQDADAVADDLVVLTHVVSGGDYGSVTVASVAVVILEDDTPTILIADAVASEGGGEMAFVVGLSIASSQTVTVEYETVDGTASAGIDYEETTGTLTFSALETEQTIRVPHYRRRPRRGGRDLHGRAEQRIQGNSRRRRGTGRDRRQRSTGSQPNGRRSGSRRRRDDRIYADANRRSDRTADGASGRDRARLVPRGRSTHRSNICGGCSDDDASDGNRQRRARRSGRRSNRDDHQRHHAPSRRIQ